MSTRALAANALVQVLFERRSLSAVLPQCLAQIHLADERAGERALAQEMCYGVLRWQPRLTAILGHLMRKPLKERDANVHTLLLLGLYQLIYMRTPNHAAVTETVSAVKVLNKAWASGLVNAVLRGYVRDAQRITAEVDSDEAAACAHPAWLLNAIKAAWPAPVASGILPLATLVRRTGCPSAVSAGTRANRHPCTSQWQAIVSANNQHPPMTLRVNARHMDRAAYLQTLQAVGIQADAALHTSHGVTLTQPVDVERLPGFKDGWISVQDAAAQLAAPLLNVQAGQRVLDACAAPGGKTAHILELQPEIMLTALDNDGLRLKRVHETLQRLNLSAHMQQGDGRIQLRQADAATPATWWDGVPFDCILLDAPCSATGVIRRHADIKYLRRPEDIAALAEQQARILEALWPLLRPAQAPQKDLPERSGGVLLYATCSILPQENQQQITQFLARHPDAREQLICADWGRPVEVGRQVLPGEDGMDGFYYAQLIKV